MQKIQKFHIDFTAQDVKKRPVFMQASFYYTKQIMQIVYYIKLIIQTAAPLQSAEGFIPAVPFKAVLSQKYHKSPG